MRWMTRNFWRSVRHRKLVIQSTTRCARCGYHYSGLHKEDR